MCFGIVLSVQLIILLSLYLLPRVFFFLSFFFHAHLQLCHVDSESLFFVIAPADIVVAKARDCDDHLTWLLQRQRMEEALKYAEDNAAALQAHTLQSISERCPHVILCPLHVHLIIFFSITRFVVIQRSDTSRCWSRVATFLSLLKFVRRPSRSIPTSGPNGFYCSYPSVQSGWSRRICLRLLLLRNFRRAPTPQFYVPSLLLIRPFAWNCSKHGPRHILMLLPSKTQSLKP